MLSARSLTCCVDWKFRFVIWWWARRRLKAIVWCDTWSGLSSVWPTAGKYGTPGLKQGEQAILGLTASVRGMWNVQLDVTWLKERFLNRRNRTKRAHYRGKPFSSYVQQYNRKQLREHVLSCFVLSKSVLLISCVFGIFFQNAGSQFCFRFFFFFFVGINQK